MEIDELPLAARLGRERVEAVVHAHYLRLLADPALRDYFSGIDDLPTHEARVSDFWWSILGGRIAPERARPGAMVEAHRPLDLPAEHLERWLALLGESLDEQLETDEATAWLALAKNIGRHMQRQGLVSAEPGADDNG